MTLNEDMYIYYLQHVSSSKWCPSFAGISTGKDGVMVKDYVTFHVKCFYLFLGLINVDGLGSGLMFFSLSLSNLYCMLIILWLMSYIALVYVLMLVCYDSI